MKEVKEAIDSKAAIRIVIQALEKEIENTEEKKRKNIKNSRHDRDLTIAELSWDRYISGLEKALEIARQKLDEL
jgi:predicted  nucleic acid-binding Zn-ribbon protein